MERTSEQLYGQLGDIDNRVFSYQTHIVHVQPKIAHFLETCFIKIPVKELVKLKDMSIVVAIQFPALTSELF